MKRYEVIESRCWKNARTGASASTSPKQGTPHDRQAQLEAEHTTACEILAEEGRPSDEAL